MHFLETILDIIDWFSDWRFNFCLWGSIILAIVIGSAIPNETAQWVVGIGIVLTGVVTGLRWKH